jgi:glycosyltransferase involved in cell wall biosynthesis
MRITLVILNTRGGGSVRAALHWANAWQEGGHEVSVVVTHPDEGTGPDFPVHPDIRPLVLDLADRPVSSSLAALWRLARKAIHLRRAVLRNRPEVIVSIDGPMNVLTLLACPGSGVPIIIFEQVHPAQYSLGPFWDKWRRRLYPRARMLLNLTDAATDWSWEHFSPRDAMTIPNPVLPEAAPLHRENGPGGTVVAAGRMVPQKRFDLLLDAFSLVAQRQPGWNLVIYGDGPDRAGLEEHARRKGLEGLVRMPGWTAQLPQRLAECDLFVLSSGYEGFGNVIAEAMAAGLPVVSFDCVAGPSDIIRHGVDGLLVPALDVQALAEAMERLMADADLRRTMARRAPEVLDRFSLQRTLELWDEAFRRVGVDPSARSSTNREGK